MFPVFLMHAHTYIMVRPSLQGGLSEGHEVTFNITVGEARGFIESSLSVFSINPEE